MPTTLGEIPEEIIKWAERRYLGTGYRYIDKDLQIRDVYLLPEEENKYKKFLKEAKKKNG